MKKFLLLVFLIICSNTISSSCQGNINITESFNNELFRNVDIKSEFTYKGIEIGDKVTKVKNVIGEPDRIDLSEYGFKWYVYNKNYENFAMFGILGEKVVGIYSNTIGFGGKANIDFSKDRDYIRNKYKVLKGIRKGNTDYILNTKDQYDVIKINNMYITIFYDAYNYYKITAIQVIEKSIEENMKGFYGNGSDELKISLEKEIFDLSNSIRVRNEMIPFIWDEKATNTARKHSTDMSNNNYFNHVNKSGETPFDRMKKDNIKYSLAGENIAAGQTSAIFAHEAWMNSLGHRKNILTNFKKVGVGVAFGGDFKIYYTQNFYTSK